MWRECSDCATKGLIWAVKLVSTAGGAMRCLSAAALLLLRLMEGPDSPEVTTLKGVWVVLGWMEMVGCSDCTDWKPEAAGLALVAAR